MPLKQNPDVDRFSVPIQVSADIGRGAYFPGLIIPERPDLYREDFKDADILTPADLYNACVSNDTVPMSTAEMLYAFGNSPTFRRTRHGKRDGFTPMEMTSSFLSINDGGQELIERPEHITETDNGYRAEGGWRVPVDLPENAGIVVEWDRETGLPLETKPRQDTFVGRRDEERGQHLFLLRGRPDKDGLYVLGRLTKNLSHRHEANQYAYTGILTFQLYPVGSDKDEPQTPMRASSCTRMQPGHWRVGRDPLQDPFHEGQKIDGVAPEDGIRYRDFVTHPEAHRSIVDRIERNKE